MVKAFQNNILSGQQVINDITEINQQFKSSNGSIFTAQKKRRLVLDSGSNQTSLKKLLHIKELENYFNFNNSEKNIQQQIEQESLKLAQKNNRGIVHSTPITRDTILIDQSSQELLIYSSLIALFTGVLIAVICMMFLYFYKENKESPQQQSMRIFQARASFRGRYENVFHQPPSFIQNEDAAKDLELFQIQKTEVSQQSESFADIVIRQGGLSKNESEQKTKENVIHVKLNDFAQSENELVNKKTRVWNLNNMRETVQDPLQVGFKKIKSDKLSFQTLRSAQTDVPDQKLQFSTTQNIFQENRLLMNDQVSKNWKENRMRSKSRSNSRSSDAGGEDGLEGVIMRSQRNQNDSRKNRFFQKQQVQLSHQAKDPIIESLEHQISEKLDKSSDNLDKLKYQELNEEPEQVDNNVMRDSEMVKLRQLNEAAERYYQQKQQNAQQNETLDNVVQELPVQENEDSVKVQA